MAHWIKGELYAKIMVLNSRDEKVISLARLHATDPGHK